MRCSMLTSSAVWRSHNASWLPSRCRSGCVCALPFGRRCPVRGVPCRIS
jgi:hypothetical protein